MRKKSVVVRNAVEADVPAIVEVAAKAYSRWSSEQLANERNYRMQIATFPEGQFVAVKDDKIVGYCSSLIVSLDDKQSLGYSTHLVMPNPRHNANKRPVAGQRWAMSTLRKSCT